MSKTPGELIQEYSDLKKAKEALEEQVKDINNQMTAIEFKLIPAMEEQDIDKLSTNVGTVTLKVEMYPQVDDMTALIKWAYENDRPDILQKRVGSKAFKEYFEEENEYPDGISTYEKKGISFRKK
jgi:hypothetical protein